MQKITALLASQASELFLLVLKARVLKEHVPNMRISGTQMRNHKLSIGTLYASDKEPSTKHALSMHEPILPDARTRI